MYTFLRTYLFYLDLDEWYEVDELHVIFMYEYFYITLLVSELSSEANSTTSVMFSTLLSDVLELTEGRRNEQTSAEHSTTVT